MNGATPAGGIGCVLPWKVGSCVIQAAGNSVLQEVLGWFSGGVTFVMKSLLVSWLFATPSPDVTSGSSASTWLQSILSPMVLIVTVASVLVTAAKMGISGDLKHGADLGQSLGKAVAVAGLVGPVTALSIAIGDEFSVWVLGLVNLSPATAGKVALFYAGGVTQAPLLVIIIGFIVVLAQVFQFLLMIARNAMVLLLVGGLPLAASASNTETGAQWMKRSIAWLFAFVLYRPVAALIYALALKLFNQGSLSAEMYGVALMILALLALPALMKLMVPATAALGGSNAGGMAMAATGAMLATGASVASMGAGGGGLLGSFAGGGGGAMGGAKGAGGATPPSGNAAGATSSPTGQFGAAQTAASSPVESSGATNGSPGPAGSPGGSGESGGRGAGGNTGSTGGAGSSGADALQVAQRASGAAGGGAQGATSATGAAEDVAGAAQ